MNIQPVSILLTIFGGLILAGLLGWIRKPRLVVFVPRLFSHSRISDKGQIVEISVMNRGFKTEENIELSLSPSMHYELIGSNNPDATLVNSKLLIPRIGSADDCSALLLVENGRFTHSEIVNCLSKETKANIATKLEDVPVTAQQRVGILMFFGVIALAVLLFVKGIDYLTNKATSSGHPAQESNQKVDTQDWNVGGIYKSQDNAIYQSLIKHELTLSTGQPQIKKDLAIIPVAAKNSSTSTLTLRVELISSAEQSPLDYSKRILSDAVLFQGDTLEKNLQVVIPAEPHRRKVIAELFIESADGETLSARKIIDLSGS